MTPHASSLTGRLRRLLAFVFLLNAAFCASAFTTKDVETISGAYSSAFYQVNGTNGWIKDTQTGGVAYFWGQAEMIETVIDAYEWTSNSVYRGMITNLLNGFLTHETANWSWNMYNDDIMWAVLAFARGGVLTGNSNYCNVAKANFDLCYARGWDLNLGGGIYWTTDKASKNACANGNAAIAAYLLHEIYGDVGYLNKANAIYNWERSVLFNASTGIIADNIGTNGVVNGGATTYNQGTFIGAAHFLGHTNDAARAANHTMMNMTSGGILPQYGIAGNNSGFNAIYNRWLVRYVRDRNLQGVYQGWLQTNATAAWNVRRADNLSWCQWRQPSPGGVNFYAWDCISSLSAIVAAAPTQPVSPSPVPMYPIGYWPLDESSGNVAADVSGNTNHGAVTSGTWNGSGKVNGCLTFNGVSSSVQVTNKLGNDFSIAMWVKTTQTAGTPQWYNGVGLVDGDMPFNSNDFGTALVGGKFAFGIGNPDVTIQSTSSINDGDWHLCVATREQSSGAIKVYVDGLLQAIGTGTKNTLSASTRLLFGAISSGGHYFSGSLDEVKLFTRALDAGEVAALYNSRMILPSTTPSNVVAVAGPARIQLSWGDAAGATSYNLRRALVSGGPYTILTNVVATSFTDTTVANNRTYYYVVSGVNPVGEGVQSSEASASTLGLAAWFRADALTGLANGASVSRWNDTTGNGYDAIQPVGLNQPTYVAGAINGLPAIRFNPTNSSYLWTYRPVQDDFTIVLVFRSNQGVGTGTSFWDGAGLLSGERPAPVDDFAVSLNANGQVLAGTGNPDRTLQSAFGFNNNQPHVVTFKRVRSTGAITLYVDSSAGIGNTGGTQSLTAPNFLVLGAQAVLNNYLNGDIAEMQIYHTPLSDSDRLGIEAALKCKYGIAGGSTPNPPAGLAGVAGNRRVSLNWTLSPGATSYSVLRSTDGGAYTPIAMGLVSSSYVDTNAINGVTNHYQVAATSGCGTGPGSTAIAIDLPLPEMGVVIGGDVVTVSWPEWASDWVLLATTNLSPPVAWTPVTNTPIQAGNIYTLSLPMDSQNRFYRLAAP
jgi:predicted alpha-1,6-mannanase (GH76 family)